MVKFLIKNTAEYRFETMEDVKSFHQQLLDNAAAKGYQLASFSWSEKYEKEKGEVVAVFYDVKAITVHNDLKMPTNDFYRVEFPKGKED